MYPNLERIVASNQAATECLLAIGNIQMAAFERLVALRFNIFRTIVGNCLEHAREGLGTEGSQDPIHLNTIACQRSIEDAIAYLRSVYDVALQAHGELARVMEAQLAQLDAGIAEDPVNTPFHPVFLSGVARAAVKSALAIAGSTYENLNRISTHTSRLTDAGFSAAIQGVRGAGKQPRKSRPAGAIDSGSDRTMALQGHS